MHRLWRYGCGWEKIEESGDASKGFVIVYDIITFLFVVIGVVLQVTLLCWVVACFALLIVSS